MSETEMFLRLREPLLGRLTPLPDPKVLLDDGLEYPDEPESYVYLVWPGRQKGDKWLSGGGWLTFCFGDRVDPSGKVYGQGDRLIATNLMVHDIKGSDPPRRNQFESLSAILTTVATINRMAHCTDNPITHLVRANESSAPFFDRFVKARLYYYSDLEGKRIESPEQCGRDFAYTLYACQYPIDEMGNLLENFVVQDAVDKLATARDGLKIEGVIL